MNYQQKVYVAPMRRSIPNKTKPKAKNTEPFMNRKAENVKRTFTMNFDLFLGISVEVLVNFSDIFTAIDTATYFKKVPINIFKNKLFLR